MGHAQAAMLAHKIKQVDLRLIASLATAHFYCAKKSSKLSYCYY